MGPADMIAACTVATSAVAVTIVCVPFVTMTLCKICVPHSSYATTTNVATALSTCTTKVSLLVDLGGGDERL